MTNFRRLANRLDMARVWNWLLFGPTLAVLASCGPIESMVVIGDAKVALEAARTVDAEHHAPYEYRVASEYLVKAREEVGYAEYQVAIELAEHATRFAEQARIRSLGSPERGPEAAKPEVSAPVPKPSKDKAAPVNDPPADSAPSESP